MTGCPDPNVLAALDELGDDERAGVIDHAASCPSCRGVVMAALGNGSVAATVADSQAPLQTVRDVDIDEPRVVDRYQIERRLGAGAMGVVYAAYDPELDRRVALKLLRGGGSPERLRREAQVLAKLTHPNIVAVYDAGRFGAHAFVAMALVDGDNLRRWLDRPRAPREIIAVLAQAARGLAVAHDAGIVHRDIKPDNIFVGRDGKALVGDFGLARPSIHPPDIRDSAPVESSDLTRTGTVLGTPVYMAPEQIAGDATAASDQFSLCVTAWEALYGARPFDAITLDAIATAIRRGPPAAAPKPGVPARVVAAIRMGLAANPADRHPSMAALALALEPPQPRRRTGAIVAGLVAAAIVGTVGIVMATRDPDDPIADAVARCDDEPTWSAPSVTAAPPLDRVIDKTIAAYADAWNQQRHAACVADARHELPAGQLAATRACLDRRRQTLETHAIALVAKKPLVALELVEQLESADGCRTASPAAPTSSSDDRVRVDVMAVAQRIDGALSGEDLDALVRIGDATATADPALAAEALFVAGAAMGVRGRTAEPLLDRAMMLADRSRDDRIRARAASALAEYLAKNGRVAEAIHQRDIAASALARTDDPISWRAVHHATAVLAHNRDAGAQITALRELADQIARTIGDRSYSLLSAMFELAIALDAANAPGRIEAHARVQQLAHALSPDGSLEGTLGTVAGDNLHDELRSAQRAVADTRTSSPDAALPVALMDLGLLYERLGDLDSALAANLEALAILDRNDAATKAPTNLGDALLSAAILNHDLGERATDAAARTSFLAKALELVDRQREVLGPNSAGDALHGRILLAQERYAEALPFLRKALADAEAQSPRNSHSVAIRAFGLARALWETGGLRDQDRARALLAEAEEQFAAGRAFYTANLGLYGVALDTLEQRYAVYRAWKRAHP